MKRKSTSFASPQSLFKDLEQEMSHEEFPLSVRMRPQRLEEVVGQEHILSEGKLLPRALKADRLTSLILYGPPGVGKTTIAYCIKKTTQAHFEYINAVVSNVDELRKILSAGKNRRLQTRQKTILFIDEIHRFNKAQQDVLMPDLEEGYVILIGATVFNPFFSLISPLLSRSLIFELVSLKEEDILKILKRAGEDKDRGLGNIPLKADLEALKFLSRVCDGDARRALNAFETGILTTPAGPDGKIHFTIEVAQESIQKKQVVYDRKGDGHYDTASAFIKSMRGSDPNATLYWLAKMVYAGEDFRFIARRICICAAEDVGNADPQALVVANAAMQIAEFIGMPEARIPLSQAAVYVACAPKSNAAYMGLENALEDIKAGRLQEVPTHLKGTGYKGAEKLGHGEGYKYVHNEKNHFVWQEYIPVKKAYYHPTSLGFEKTIQERLKNLK